VSALSIEDAVLRVVRAVLVAPPEAPASGPRPDQKRPQLEELQAKIDRLVTMHLDGKITTDDYNRIYPQLLAEREELQRRASTDTQGIQAQQVAVLAAKDELTRPELRQLVHLVVERVEAP